jgi:hypothetical protein
MELEKPDTPAIPETKELPVTADTQVTLGPILLSLDLPVTQATLDQQGMPEAKELPATRAIPDTLEQ